MDTILLTVAGLYAMSVLLMLAYADHALRSWAQSFRHDHAPTRLTTFHPVYEAHGHPSADGSPTQRPSRQHRRLCLVISLCPLVNTALAQMLFVRVMALSLRQVLIRLCFGDEYRYEEWKGRHPRLGF